VYEVCGFNSFTVFIMDFVTIISILLEFIGVKVYIRMLIPLILVYHLPLCPVLLTLFSYRTVLETRNHFGRYSEASVP